MCFKYKLQAVSYKLQAFKANYVLEVVYDVLNFKLPIT
jgi:hypothetical protein